MPNKPDAEISAIASRFEAQRQASEAPPWVTEDQGKRDCGGWAGYPGRQSLRFFALGYFLPAPTGRQTELLFFFKAAS